MSFREVLIVGWQYLRAFVLIYLCLLTGNAISSLLPIIIPGSIIGMLILFVLLAFQLIPAHWAKPGCSLLLKNMTLLFLPIGVGVMNYYDQLSQQIIPIVFSCLISTAIVMIIVAYSSHYVHHERPIIGSTSEIKSKQQKQEKQEK
ncbi:MULTISPECIES: CidA/LrgA family protein [Photorhabdus]|nr:MULTISPECIES: CidA/LrgA family protein [Photorhabdus]MCC8464709.1 CidA/LrgA family protein [Photorhabdus bodei]MCT8352492.1 CidA/LrgA family protein [Photorhabdus kayaii]MDB6366491.1 CidA/LrgA family protein [Photorhabdus bodei]MDB6373605.1 CidA/LrgA family protein [Photorhabdus bodei]